MATPRINAFGWIFIGALIVGGIALAGDGKAAPKPKKLAFDLVNGPPAEFRVGYAINKSGLLELSLDGKPVIPPGTDWGIAQSTAFGGDPFGSTSESRLAVERARDFARIWQASGAQRRKLLPPDASQHMTDEYSKELYGIPAWVTRDPNTLSAHMLVTHGTGILVDEFGRTKPGHYGSGGGLLDPVGNLFKNPLFQVVLGAAAFAFGGPVGFAAYGAFNAYVINGQEISAESVVLTTARTYAVSQCGPACGMAFDIGVGVASGRDVDEVAVETALNQMSPTERAAYNEGLKLYKEGKKLT